MHTPRLSAPGQITYAAALAHQDCVVRVADKFRKKKLPQSLAVGYDTACRKKWAELSALQLDDFDVNKAALEVDKARLRLFYTRKITRVACLAGRARERRKRLRERKRRSSRVR